MYGLHTFPGLPSANFEAGVDLGSCQVLPFGNRIVYLRSTGPADDDPPALTGRIVQTLSAAIAQCRSGRCDTIMVLPGHTESVSSATALSGLVAGTRIVGIGRGSNMPVFRWTAAAATWAINVADVVISGLRLRLEGYNGVTKAINVTGADCLMTGCDIEFSSGASNIATIGIELGTGAHRAVIAHNKLRGTTGVSTNVVLVAGVIDQAEIRDNVIVGPATAANGLVNISVAATNILVARNIIANQAANSSACIAIANSASTGVISDNRVSVLLGSTATIQGIVFTSTGSLIRCFENYCSDEKQKSGILTPTAAT